MECVICLEEIGEKNKITTECGHTFHASCIFKNLSQRNGCPMCRVELMEKSESDDECDDESVDESSDDDNPYPEDETDDDLDDDLDEETREEYEKLEKEKEKYLKNKRTDPKISSQQIADKMIQLGATTGDLYQ